MTKFDLPKLLTPLRQQGWHWTPEGKLVPGNVSVQESVPWVCQNLDFDCYLWNRVFFHGAAKERMTHTHCQTCFKVVVMPRNFLELIELQKWQAECGLRCKCGIEVRDYVGRAYGGYFYSWEPGELTPMEYDDGQGNKGVFRVVDDSEAVRKGRLKYDKVCAGMLEVLDNYHENWPEAPTLVGIMPVILKRGCTEFEAALGPTNEPRYRHISDDQMELEAAIDEHVEYDHGTFIADQPELIQRHIMLRWAEFAHFIGDMTYVQWLGHSISRPPVTYHDED
jgi:hypothetical protein